MPERSKLLRVVVVGGGTGGHVYPGLAVLEALPDAVSCAWIGQGRGIEHRLAARRSVTFFSIPAGKLRRYFSLRNIVDIFRICAGFAAALRVLLRLRPQVLFSKGGFVSVPAVFAASCLRIPVLSHESDLVPGLATRLNLRFSKALCVSWKRSADLVQRRYRSRVVHTGNPVRGDILAQLERPVVAGRIFIVGGSLGATQINTLVDEILEELLESYSVIHQHGRQYRCRLQHERYVPHSFLHEQYAPLCASSELIVCRAGAGTLSELACLGKPAILIPMRAYSRGEQMENARVFGESGAAEVLIDPDATQLLSVLRRLMHDEERRKDMARAMRGLFRAGAAKEIAAMIQEVGNERV